MQVKDHMESAWNLQLFFDLDNLKQITSESRRSFLFNSCYSFSWCVVEALTQAVQKSCAVILFLDDETTQSTWVVHELTIAQRNGIPIVVVIDTDHYKQRDLIDHYSAAGFGFLFEEQCIGYSAECRVIQANHVKCSRI